MTAPTPEQNEREMYDRYLDGYPVDADVPLTLAEWRKQVKR